MAVPDVCSQLELQVKNCESYSSYSNHVRERFMSDEYRRTHCRYFETAFQLCKGKARSSVQIIILLFRKAV